MGIFNRKTAGDKRSCEHVEPEIEYISEERIISQSEEMGEETKQENSVGNSFDLKFPTGDKSADLMILIGKALDEWAKMYHLQGMPTKVVFGQALALMTAWYNNLK